MSQLTNDEKSLVKVAGKMVAAYDDVMTQYCRLGLTVPARREITHSEEYKQVGRVDGFVLMPNAQKVIEDEKSAETKAKLQKCTLVMSPKNVYTRSFLRFSIMSLKCFPIMQSAEDSIIITNRSSQPTEP